MVLALWPAASRSDRFMPAMVQVVLDVNDSEWTFVIKSWPNGGENKRVYVMEKTGKQHSSICMVHMQAVISMHASKQSYACITYSVLLAVLA